MQNIASSIGYARGPSVVRLHLIRTGKDGQLRQMTLCIRTLGVVPCLNASNVNERNKVK